MLFSPKFNEGKISDFDAIQSEIETLFNMLNTENFTAEITLNQLMNTSESVKFILPLSNLRAFTAPLPITYSERTFSKLKLVNNRLRSTAMDD